MRHSKREDFIQSALSSDIDTCILWPYSVRKSSGYPAHNHGSKNLDAHRYACERAHGQPKAGEEAAHRCGNKLCINPRHLYWADHLSNMDDAKRHGKLKGGGRYRQRIFATDIAEICRSKDSLVVLAARYGSDASYIGRLRRQHANG